MLRQGLWALQVSLAACSAYLVYAAGAALLFSPSVPEAAVPRDEPPAVRARPLAEYDVIASRNLFNTLEVAAAAPEETVEQIAESQLDVRLLGTLVGGAGQPSLAAVQDNAQLHSQVGVNDLISGARVVRIERDRIILDNQGRLEEITFPEKGAAGLGGIPAARAGLAQRAPGAAQRPAESLSDRLRRMTQQAQPTPPSATAMGVLDQLRMLPSYDVKGGLEGLKVSWVQEGSPIAQSGIQVGDLITLVNGTPVTTPAAGLQMFRELAPRTPIAVEVRRGGSAVPLLLQANP